MTKQFYFGIAAGVSLILLVLLVLGVFLYQRGKSLADQDEAERRSKNEAAILDQLKKNGVSCRNVKPQIADELSKLDAPLDRYKREKIWLGTELEKVADRLKQIGDGVLHCRIILSYDRNDTLLLTDAFAHNAYADLALISSLLSRGLIKDCQQDCDEVLIGQLGTTRNRLAILLKK